MAAARRRGGETGQRGALPMLPGGRKSSAKPKLPLAFTEGSDLERIFRAADPGTRNRVDPDQFGVFFHRSGLQACQFGLSPPRFALRGLKKSAAAAR